ncbi:carboxypeptidase-like regulatory domain-containing protein [Lamprocystis purpurea]|jgi:hypothetical protein|uniref:carboxypeptidase-like regulatory domain-containing protein n=1 Tax=Lamprocystis purpurea TaxID=61598 RepID=UPI0003805B70|nr:carboxypeptidase-like regulatory domain-containing protein [Lamprocystis purpurea]
MHDGYPWQARIGCCADLDDDEWVGAGVLIGTRQVMTCATVVAAALRVEVGAEAPAGEVAVILPLLPNPHRGIARVAAWAPHAGLDPRWTLPGTRPPGLAVLELTEPVPELVVAAALELLEPAAYRNRAVFCLGFPPEHPTGLRIHADCADEDAQAITGLETDHGSIDGSFTGTGAWDPIRGSVLGLVVAADNAGSDGFLIPSQALLAVWPQARIRQDQGVGGRLLTWLAGLDTRLGNLLLRLGAALAFAALGLVWWLEPDTPAPLPPTEPVAATSGIAGFVWERSGQPIPGVRVLIPTRAASSETDRFGRFIIRLQEPAGARIEVMVIAPGYRSLSTVQRIGDNRINLVLEPNKGDDRPVD